jgi:hypothetical protein
MMMMITIFPIHLIFLIGIVGVEIQLVLLGTAATSRPIVPAPGDYDDGEIGGIIGRGNRSTRRKAAKGEREPRPPLLHLHPMGNSTSTEDESSNFKTTPTKEPRNQQNPPQK